MPRKSIFEEPLTQAERSRRYRQKFLDDAERLEGYKESERQRKALWYAANKEKKNEAQRRYRAMKRAEG